MYNIKEEAGMSNTTYHKRCASNGQKNWWLKDINNNFINIGVHRGDQPIDINMDINPGEYILGTGPIKYGVRHKIILE